MCVYMCVHVCICVFVCTCVCVCVCITVGFFMVKILGILYNLVFCVETKNKGRMVI